MFNDQKLESITPSTLIVGVDIAKRLHWARFTNYRGLDISKSFRFSNDKDGFERILTSIRAICKSNKLTRTIVGMEPTGHYWKPLANYLMLNEITVVVVNPYHTKRAKELDDNSPTKNDQKDALTIARLIRDGRYYETYMPHNVFADLRSLSSSRISLMKRHNALKNKITALLDEYFPEMATVFKNPLSGKASLQILRACPFPSLIIELGVAGVLAEIKKAVKKTVGLKKAQQLVETARQSIGVNYGLASARLKMELMVEEFDLLKKQLGRIEDSMELTLAGTGFKEIILGVPGIGVITAASLLGEIGDPMRFNHPRQISRMAGFNLKEDSSGKNISGTTISKRGRKNLRSILYQMARVMVAVNPELRELYQYFRTRANRPLMGKQALIVIAKKILTIVYYLIKKQTHYNAELVLGEFRKNQIQQAA